MARDGRRLTVRGRLYGISAVGALLTAVIGLVGLSGYSRLNAANEAGVSLGTTQAVTLQMLALQHKIRAQVWFAYAASAGGTNRPTAEIREEFDTARERLLADNARLSALADGTRYDQQFQALAAAENALIGHAETLIDQAFGDRRAGLAQLGAFEDEADALDEQVTELSARLGRDRVAQLTAARAIERTDTRTLITAAVLAALLVVGLSALLGRSILRRLRAVGDVAHRIGAGDLNARCVVDGADEIDALADAFNGTAVKLSETMRRLTEEARREGLGSQLSEAFEMADTEAETYAVIERTMRQLGPGRPTELLLADSSKAHLTRRTANAAGDTPCCPVTSPFGCVAVRRGNPVVFEDSDALNACPKLQGRPAGRLSAVCVPVTFMGRALGVLHSTGAPGERPAPERLAALAMLAGQSGTRIGTLRSFERAQLQASTDGLTGLLNRRAFETEARDVLRGEEALVVVMADLDHFKLLNDTHGHEAGDRALRLFGQAVRATLREGDLGARLGGEEFGLVIRNVTAQQAIAVLDRLRVTLRDSAAGGTPPFTASFGVCSTDGGTPLDDLLRTADVALYRAKHEGRNRIVLADERDRRDDRPSRTEARESAIQLSARHDDLTDSSASR